MNQYTSACVLWVLRYHFYRPHFRVGLCKRLMRVQLPAFCKASMRHKETLPISLVTKLCWKLKTTMESLSMTRIPWFGHLPVKEFFFSGLVDPPKIVLQDACKML